MYLLLTDRRTHPLLLYHKYLLLIICHFDSAGAMRSDGCKIRKLRGDVRLTIEQKHRRGPGCGSGGFRRQRQTNGAVYIYPGQSCGVFCSYVDISSRVTLVVYSVDM